MLLGVDTGGTFTDFALWQGRRLTSHKVLSTPDNPARAIRQGIAELDLEPAAAAGRLRLIHGSTVATNTALEGKGVRTVYITNRGFTDVLRIGRQARTELYELHPRAPYDPVPESHLLGTGGRIDPAGRVIEPLTEADLARLREAVLQLRPEAVAINLLYSYVDDRFERRIEAELRDLAFVSRSSFVLPEYKEYERGIATWLNAWLGPVVNRYLAEIEAAMHPSRVAVMQSSGGVIDARQAGERAVNLLLSGPAGGLAAAVHIGRENGTPEMLTFDMGGTSTDVALLRGRPRLTDEGSIGPFPIAVPMAEIHTIGAGGGSIAYLDAGGALQVGPESAGAEPGPACYGRGGRRPTVTDANVALGRLPAALRLGGSIRIDAAAAREAIAPLAEALGLHIEDAAQGIVAVANERMAQALRVISLERGHDPRAFTLACFGGAGGLHVCALARMLSLAHLLVPAYCGVFSALGMLVAPPSRQLVQTLGTTLAQARAEELESRFEALEEGALAELVEEGHARKTIHAARSADLRYAGQSFYLNLPWQGPVATQAAFHRHHRQRYGHAFELPVELVNIRSELTAAQQPITLPRIPKGKASSPSATTPVHAFGDVPLLERESLGAGQRIDGPAIVTESFATTLIEPEWCGEIDARGHLHLGLRAT